MKLQFGTILYFKEVNNNSVNGLQVEKSYKYSEERSKSRGDLTGIRPRMDSGGLRGLRGLLGSSGGRFGNFKLGQFVADSSAAVGFLRGL